jgi:hypothetical protein
VGFIVEGSVSYDAFAGLEPVEYKEEIASLF